MLGSMAKRRFGCRLLISEHGIYTREREEELIRADWVSGIYKNIWIEQFKKMSKLAYDRADLVTSLYAHARELFRSNWDVLRIRQALPRMGLIRRGLPA